jgi:hypothetical protein
MIAIAADEVFHNRVNKMEDSGFQPNKFFF